MAKAGFARCHIKRPPIIGALVVVKVQSVESNAYLRIEKTHGHVIKTYA